MKRVYFYFLSAFIFFSSTFSVKVNAQKNSSTVWSTKFEYSKAFIENKGQFPYAMNSEITKYNVLYAVDQGPVKIYFTPNGLAYYMVKGKPKDKIGIANEVTTHDEWAESDNKEGKKRQYKQDEVSFTWENSNPDVEIIGEDPTIEYYSYTFKEDGQNKNVNYIKGYKKIIYKNLYPNIDVEYTFHETDGIKYSLILHPGADVSKIKMNYSDTPVLSENGDLHFTTLFGDIIDHAPKSFYSDNSSVLINSRFFITGNTVGFALGPYDNSKSVTIDPWVVNATFNTSTAVWEVETDASGNVYVIGGETPMQLQKYASTGGAPIWTYTTPWDTATVWLGTLATDAAGVSFITSGTAPEMEKINTAGSMAWHVNGSAMNDEWWSITFNCDKTKLIVGGTTLLGSFPNFFSSNATIFDIDINNGNILGSQNVDTTSLMAIGSFPVEVRSISSSKYAQYIFLTHYDVGAINQNIGSCPTDAPIFQVDNGRNLSYKCENYLPATQNGGGLKALVANDQFFYTHGGDQIQKRSLTDGSLISTASIPGGVSSIDMIFGTYIIENSGLAVDAAGNVYAGSNGSVIKYDANLNLLAQPAVSFTVYDVSVNSNGEVIAVGAQQDNQSTNRNGRIESINMSAAGQYALVCCDANICPVDTVCVSDAPFNLTATTSGGTFSGQGITNTTAGTFDPSVAGAGTWTITYTQACGTGTINITVLACATLTVCLETNGDVTVSGGTGPYNWEEWVPASSTPITNQTECTACNASYTWMGSPFNQCLDGMMPVTDCITPASWSSFGTGTTITPPGGADTIRVTDASLNQTVIYDINSLPSCTTCTANVTATNVVNVSCYGASTGSFTANGTGVAPYDYTLMLGVTTIATYNNVNGSQNFTGLPAGTYTLNIVDDSSCTGTTTVIITQPASAVSASASVVTPPSCGMSNGSVTVTASGGTGGYTYSWNSSPVQNTQTAINLPAGNYTVTVTDANSCTGTASVTLTNPNAPTLVTSSVNATCGMSNGSATVTPSGGTPPYTYLWNTVPPQSLQTATGLAPGTYYVTVTDDLNCTGIDSVTVIDTSSFSADAGANQGICTGNSATLTATGGTTYLWSTGASTATINVTPAATTTYTVTVSDGTCTATDNVTVTVTPPPTPNITGDTLICTGASVTLTASGGSSYLWSTSDTTAVINVTPVGSTTYNVTVSNAGCSSTADITINLSVPPNADAGNDTTINIGTSAQLDGSGGIGFSWSPSSTLSCANCADPVASPLSTTTYVLIVTDANGCTNADTVVVTVDMECGEVFVPNAFSPNNDGNNELECVYGNCIQTMEFAIFDRWGNKVFFTTDPKECWDGTFKGKALNTGVYDYYMKASLYDGTEAKRQGNIHLFR